MTEDQIKKLREILGTEKIDTLEEAIKLCKFYLDSGMKELIKKAEDANEYIKKIDEKNEKIENKKIEILNDTYKIISEIGSGGEASIYLAKIIDKNKIPSDVDVSIGEVVAIREYKKSSEKNQFYESAELLKSFSKNKNIVKYIHGFEDEKTKSYFLVTEYLDGLNLKQINNRLNRKITPEEASIIAYYVLSALTNVHMNKHVHCDINPKNIIITKKGEIKLIDFGLAYDINSNEKVYSAGTIHYLSPQQIIGDIDYGTDIHSLGLTLFELLTKRKLFDDNSEKIEEKIENIKRKKLKGIDPQIIQKYLLKSNRSDPEDVAVYDMVAKMIESASVEKIKCGQENNKGECVEYIKLNKGYINSYNALQDCVDILSRYNLAYLYNEDLPFVSPLIKNKEATKYVPGTEYLYDLKMRKLREIINEVILPHERFKFFNKKAVIDNNKLEVRYINNF